MMWFDRPAAAQPMLASSRPLMIGLVNNASDGALHATERQFLGLLRLAGGATDVRFKLFSCPEIRRGATPVAATGQPYCEFASLFDTRLDGLIVTGMEPQAAKLEHEPAFDRIADIAAWADAQGLPVIWSCLAAHAAVLSLDGISREPLDGKLSGVFDVDIVARQHPLTRGLPARMASPHSRYNGLSEATLRAHGYQVLSRSDEAGVDTFVKQGNAAFVFCQGHPEYEADTLLLEYRRDIRRYFAGKREDYPATPKRYFDADAAGVLEAMRQEALRRPRYDMPGAAARAEAVGMASACRWRTYAERLYANWLALLVCPVIRDDGHALALQAEADPTGHAGTLLPQPPW